MDDTTPRTPLTTLPQALSASLGFGPGEIRVVDARGHLVGGVHSDGKVFVEVGLRELLQIAAAHPAHPADVVLFTQMAYQAGLNASASAARYDGPETDGQGAEDPALAAVPSVEEARS